MIRLGLAQVRGVLGDKEHNLARALTILHEFSKRGCDYVIFPELFLSGYYIRNHIRQLAEPLTGDSIRALCRQARELNIGVVMGFPEEDNGRFYNSAVLIERNGSITGISRKTHLFAEEKEYFHQGDDCPLHTLVSGERVAIMMTFDLEFPELPRQYALQGADIFVVLHAHTVPYESHQELFLRVRALENQVFVAAANRVGLENTTLFFGVSGVVSPTGEFLVKGGNDEELVTADVDVCDIQTVRQTELMNYLGNRRADIYQKFHE